jgi:hypothetical protein
VARKQRGGAGRSSAALFSPTGPATSSPKLRAHPSSLDVGEQLLAKGVELPFIILGVAQRFVVSELTLFSFDKLRILGDFEVHQ